MIARTQALGMTLLSLAVGACAYHTNAASMPPHIKTIAIPVFENTTTEYTLDQEITNAVIRAFVADNHLRVVDERRADSVLRGKIVSYRNSVFGISPVSRAQEYRVTIGVQVTFKDQVKNREIWTDEILQSANYYVQNVPGDSATTELDGRKLAVGRIATEILTRSVESW